MGIRVTVIMGVPCVQSSYCCLVWFVNIGVKFMRKAISDLDEFPKPLKSKVRILIGLIHHKDATATSRVMIILQLFIGEPPHTHTHPHTQAQSLSSRHPRHYGWERHPGNASERIKFDTGTGTVHSTRVGAKGWNII